MPNPLGRRRVDTTPADAKDEIARLKDELNDLRKLYLQDMANVSSDMRALVSQLSPTPEPAPTVVEEPAPVEPVVE
jgi:archaellum component FlaC